MGSIRSRILTHVLNKEESLETSKLFLVLKAFLLDRGNASSVNGFNDSVQKLINELYPEASVPSKSPDTKIKNLKDLTLDFKKLQSGSKIKNFEEVKL